MQPALNLFVELIYFSNAQPVNPPTWDQPPSVL
jgi:hypothetical protein